MTLIGSSLLGNPTRDLTSLLVHELPTCGGGTR